MNLDFNKLYKYAQDRDIGLEVFSWEDVSIKVMSAAPSETYYQKRVYNIDSFIQDWEKHVEEERKYPLEIQIARAVDRGTY